MTPMQIDQFLASPCHALDEPDTWRDWFQNVLVELIEQDERFSGKRPGCNSDWQEKLALALNDVCPGVAERGKGTNIDCVNINAKKYKAACNAVIVRLIHGTQT